ncbi:thermonuclease family protein [Tropicimonas sp. IMCC6043]|uniref:thermonuclease family protein n=1 Tax=Tropicimonas sp. IMCC6043 TaxID=2510645 RepID=UPI00101D9415|nr:hypothetical protein [Tropicimonas sp. IMCC6043]RYH12363.1 hypothetical protein EU800_02045 [Tropicimonas sp. IMCC6043]
MRRKRSEFERLIGKPPPRRQRSPSLRRTLRGNLAWIGGLSRGQWVIAAIVAVVFLPHLITLVAGALKPTSEGCRVLSVVDGDTVRMYCPKDGVMSTRLTGFDTPEFRGQCGSERLKAMAATYVLHWQIWTARGLDSRHLGRDRYGRRLSALFVGDALLADRMIATGLAREYDGGPRRGWCGTD